MTQKPWLNSYPAGVPAQIDLSTYYSVVDVLEQSCQKFRDKTAFICMGSEIDFGELDRLSRNFAATLQSRGLKQGDRVALMMPNILQYPVALFGILRAGMVVVNTNPLYTARELRHQLVDSGARAIVVIENFAQVLQQVRHEVPVEHVFTTRVGDMLDFPRGAMVNFVLKYVKKVIPAWSLPGSGSFSDALSDGEKLPLAPASVGFEDIAFLQYTGGTTGVSKGAMLSHRNMVYNVQQSITWQGAAYVGVKPIVAITALPLYHIFSLQGNCLTVMAQGGENVLITNPRDFDGFAKEIAKFEFNMFTGVNTMFAALMDSPNFSEIDFSYLRVCIGGGMAVQPAIAKECCEPADRVRIAFDGLRGLAVATENKDPLS